MTAKQIAERAIKVIADTKIEHFLPFPEKMFGIANSDKSPVEVTMMELIGAMKEEFRYINGQFAKKEYESLAFDNWVYTIQEKIIINKSDPLIACDLKDLKYNYLRLVLLAIKNGQIEL